MAKMIQPATNPVSPPTKNPGAVATDTSNANVKSAPLVAPLQLTHRSPITLTSSSQPMVADVRNASFTTNQKVAVDSAPPPPAQPSRLPVSGGVLNGNALSLPAPVYSESARRMSIVGVVEVEVTIDKNGKVSSAKAVSGPAILRDSAVQAALRARFTPSKLSGQPVKVTGRIIYNFKRPQ